MKFRLTAKLKTKLLKVLWITLIFTIFGILEVLYVHVLSFDFDGFEITPLYNFNRYLLVNIISTFLGGTLLGFILVFFLRGRFRDRSFGVSVFLNTIILLAILIVFSTIGISAYNSYVQGIPFFSQQAFRNSIHSISSFYFFKTITFYLAVIFLVTVLLDVNEKYGAGVLRQLLMGKYHHPREEERIFMFLDMRGSTTIAEKIGHIEFFELLNDFFKDINDPVIFTNGSIYQYIGDEVVIVWKMRKGIKNANCIRCFYNIREAISNRKDYYLNKYGVVPEFKAGLHCGKVTIGEIGVQKRDVVFSGDVLNTTARIQSMCNDFKVKLLISKRLLDKVSLPPDSFEDRKIGNISLKGKKKKVVLYTIEEA